MNPIETYLASLKPRTRTEALRELERWSMHTGDPVAHWRVLEPWASVSTDTLTDYLASLAPGVQSKARWLLRSMLALAQRHDLDEGPGSRRPAAPPMTTDQQRRLLAEVDGPNGTAMLRDVVILALMLDTGILAEELRNLSWSAIDGDRLNLQREEGRASWRLSRGTVQALDAWASLSGDRTGVIVRPVDRFGRVQPTRISTRAITYAVERAGERIGLTLSPIDLRRSWLSRARAGGVPIELTELATGH